MPDQLAPESAEEQDVLVDEFEELAVRGKDEARRPPGRLPDAAAVAAMATPTLCELLQDPAKTLGLAWRLDLRLGGCGGWR